jgi:phosphohistidine phosphatase SixA
MPSRSLNSRTNVILIRHAEKPDDEDDPHLSELGKARAMMLAAWAPKALRPDILIAARSRKGSSRPHETLVPLARKLRKRIDATYDDKRPSGLATQLRGSARFRGKTVLVSWRHDGLPSLARLLGAKGVPPKWPQKRYDWMWELRLEDDRPVRLRVRRQPTRSKWPRS